MKVTKLNERSPEVIQCSILASDYRSLAKNSPQGLPKILRHNVLIGRNNSGKSAYLDALEFALRKTPSDVSHSGEVTYFLTFPNDKPSYINVALNWPDFANAAIEQKKSSQQEWAESVTMSSGLKIPRSRLAEVQQFLNVWYELKKHSLGFIVRRLAADRDIVVEEQQRIDLLTLSSDGKGFTSLVQADRHKNGRKRKQLIQVYLLDALNRICQPDYSFTEIDCRQLDDDKWEVALTESEKGEVLLSASGSGLKTLLLVLGNTLLVPFQAAETCQSIDGILHPCLDGYAFMFEELENNLHPSILRRLLQYLISLSQAFDCRFFYTTHSNVIVDAFAARKDSQIVHVSHDNKKTSISPIGGFLDHRKVLEELDFRASDLLQANVLIWVEGPSDRILINRWIELWSNGSLNEGLHYQVVHYGGSLINHISSVVPGDRGDEYVKLLRICKRAILVVDSDKTKRNQKLKPAVKRMSAEIKESEGVIWITKGKEIENYIPYQACNAAFPRLCLNAQPPETDSLYDVRKRGIKQFANKKAEFASLVAPHMNLQDCCLVLDLKARTEELIKAIRRWNNLRLPDSDVDRHPAD